MKKDYSLMTVREAVETEMSSQFVDAIKLMDKKIVIARLQAIMNVSPRDFTYVAIVGQFLSILNSKTSADE